MAFKPVKKYEWELIAFEEVGDRVEGRLVEIEERVTKYGAASLLLIETMEDQKVSVIVSSALQGYNWEKMIGKVIGIEFTGHVKNPNTGRKYKDFTVEIDG